MVTPVHTPLSAAVLAGGKSSRMGQDKALLPLVAGGPPLLSLVLDRLREVADDVCVVANEGGRYERFGARVVPDREQGIGALGGIYSALLEATHDYCLIVACDMPFLSRDLLRRMASEPRTYDVLVPLLPGQSRQRSDGLVYQTLHAIYGKACVPHIKEQMLRGNRQVIGFFDHIQLRTIGLESVHTADPDLLSFFNANTPEALAQARSLAERQEPAGF
jgi:molybdopterin-guanine dinucleotide biosynthesis protein A